jgi:hypothetical protein
VTSGRVDIALLARSPAALIGAEEPLGPDVDHAHRQRLVLVIVVLGDVFEPWPAPDDPLLERLPQAVELPLHDARAPARQIGHPLGCGADVAVRRSRRVGAEARVHAR